MKVLSPINENSDAVDKAYVDDKIKNGTLTIQKNGTDIQTFSANQSSSVTANITVPTKTSDLTNDSNYITNNGSTSGNAGTATKLATARTIGIGTGATGTATSFDGSSNITIPITDVKDAYISWGGKSLSANISPDDMGCIDEFGHNKLAFLPASCITVEYTTDGGTTWSDYGLTDTQKIQMVTNYDVQMTIGKGTASAKEGTMTNANCGNYKVRVKISTRDGNGNPKLYTAGKKWLINLNSNGAPVCKCLVEQRTIDNYNKGNDTWSTVGTYDVGGWSGWNSLPASTFGGGYSQTSQIADIRFTLYITSVNTSFASQAQFLSFRLIGGTNWTMPSEIARAGHLYTMDAAQNAIFPNNVSATSFNNYTLAAACSKGVVTSVDTSANLPTSNAVKTFVEGKGYTSIVPSAYCNTAAATAAKTATCSGYALLDKSYIQVILVNANSSQTALTLNVNGKGSKPIYINGSSSSTTNYTLPAGSYFVYYDGTNYYFRTDGKITGDITGSSIKSTILLTNPNSGTWYYPTWVTGLTNNTAYQHNVNDGFRYYSLQGTASAAGRTILQVGNATATGTAGNKYGELRIYAEKAGYATIKATASATSETVHTLPNTTGTILNSGTTSFTQTLTGGTEIGSIKINGTTQKIYAPTPGSVTTSLASPRETYYLTGVQTTTAGQSNLYNSYLSSTYTGIKYVTSTSQEGGSLYVDDREVVTGLYYEIS